jgi:hypothetical protein
MGLFSCLLGNRPSKWLTGREKLLIFMRIFLLILAFVEKCKRQTHCNFYKEMYSFVNLANENVSKYDDLTNSEKESYQRRLHEILKGMSHNQTYFIGGTWWRSWSLPQLYAFYEAVIFEVKQTKSFGDLGVSERYDLPHFRYSQSSDPLIRQNIERSLFGVLFDLPPEMCQDFPVVFKSASHPQPLNVPPPVVLNQSVDSSANWTNLAGMSKALALATPRGTPRHPPMCNDPSKDPTPAIAPKPIEICTPLSTPRTPRTPRLPGFSNWLLFELLSPKFLNFLRQQAEQSKSKQLTQMFKDLGWFFTRYGVELVHYQNSVTIFSFFQALNRNQLVKTALELYHGERLDGWMDMRIVTDSHEENQKLFFQYLMMIINLNVWLSDDEPNKSEFSAECAGKLWVFDYEFNSFKVYKLSEQLRAA